MLSVLLIIKKESPAMTNKIQIGDYDYIWLDEVIDSKKSGVK